jgi:hypothetical protein
MRDLQQVNFTDSINSEVRFQIFKCLSKNEQTLKEKNRNEVPFWEKVRSKIYTTN